MTSSPAITPAVPAALRRGPIEDEAASVVEAHQLIDLMCRRLGRPDLAEVDVLDIGCGTRFTQAICTYGLPLGSYTGVDVSAPIVEFLQSTVGDPRFRFVTYDVHNELYNPASADRAGARSLDLPTRAFDVVCGFSLFTHLAPDDTAAMLELMRRHVADDGRLFFTAYLNESTAGGHGLIDRWAAAVLTDEQVERAMDEHRERDDFVDLTPSRPLLHAVYSRPHARRLVEAAGWEIVDIHDPIPEPSAQHQFVCRPA